MRAKIVAALIIGWVILSSISFGYSGGSGTAANPYKIMTKADLLELAGMTGDYGKYFVLMADIDLESQIFTKAIIAPDTGTGSGFQGAKFTGNFDGDNHKITRFTINGGSNHFLGLFGNIDSGGVIKNLGVQSFLVGGSTQSDFVGGLVACNYGTINNCYATGTINNGYRYIGGLVGFNYYGGNISHCYSTGTVNGCDLVGGLVGETDGSVSYCYATGNVTGAVSSTVYYNVGGLAGASDGGNISNCYATGSVVGRDIVGGFIGHNLGYISNCYSTGHVSGSLRVGGFAGINYSGTNSFWDTQTSGKTSGAGDGSSTGVTGKTTAQMKTQSTFTGWDFTNTWYMNGYPSLKWEINPLQAQIDAAANGATIVVQPGLYQGRLYFKGKNITLTSTNPQDPAIVASTVIQGLGSGSVITFVGTETSACVLRGFTITGGNSATSGGGVIGNDCSAGIQNCRFYGNTAAGAGGGIWGVHGPIENCIVYNNTALWGGGIAKSNGIIRNCLVFGNQSPNATSLNNCDGAIQNCTIVSDQTLPLLRVCDGTIQNCILQTPGPVFDTCTAAVSYTCLPGATGTGNISFDPKFVDPVNGDYHLLPESPCMDAGNPASDYSLEPMPNGGRVDLGSYGNTPQATLSRNVLTSLGFQIITKTRTGRTLFEYELAVVIRNPNAYDMSNVQMKLKDWDAAVVSVGDDRITIDSIPAGAMVTSTDTFKIVVDRSMLIVPGMLTWDLIYYVPGGQVQQAMMSMALSMIDTVGGDITGDGSANLEDFTILAQQWNAAPGTPSADIALPLDNYVGIEDLIYLAENWLK